MGAIEDLPCRQCPHSSVILPSECRKKYFKKLGSGPIFWLGSSGQRKKLFGDKCVRYLCIKCMSIYIENIDNKVLNESGNG